MVGGRPVVHSAGFFCGKIPLLCYLPTMIHLTKGNTETIYATLSEKQTLTSPNYLMRFLSRTSKDEVSFVLLNASDTSLYKNRYNKFAIKVDKYFSRKESGEWTYFIYEQASASNDDYTESGSLLETGIMRLSESTTFSYTQYASDNTYITRQ